MESEVPVDSAVRSIGWGNITDYFFAEEPVLPDQLQTIDVRVRDDADCEFGQQRLLSPRFARRRTTAGCQVSSAGQGKVIGRAAVGGNR